MSSDKPTVMIVEDMPANIQILAACLKDDYQIKVATSGEQCLQLIEQGTIPDIVLLDIEMPTMSGYEVCTALNENSLTKEIPVIFITGKGEADAEEYGLSLGAVDYITKPVNPPIVRARVKTHVTLKQQRDKLTSMAMFDQLTGLYNRHYLLEKAVQCVSRATRHNHDLSVMIIDADHFKRVNDEHGHQVGDEVLVALSKIFKHNSRIEDVVARFGGEEFVVLLEQCNLEQAQLKAESLRRSVEMAPIAGLSITCSFGVATLAEDGDYDRMLVRADRALYMAKEQGRNRVVGL